MYHDIDEALKDGASVVTEGACVASEGVGDISEGADEIWVSISAGLMNSHIPF